MVGFEVGVNKRSEEDTGGREFSAEEWNVLACYLIYLIASFLLELAYY